MATSTKIKFISKRSSKYLEDVLYWRLLHRGGSEQCVREELDLFLKSRKRVYKWEVSRAVRLLRSRNRFDTALKLMEEMCKRGMNHTLPDHALRLDLVAKAKGISSAEDYFIKLPEPAKSYHTYGALLNCYCKETMTEKAEGLIEKMEELNFTPGPMPYNSLMTLYMKVNQPERVSGVIQKMKAKNIIPDCFTYNIWMRSLAVVKDISGVERVMEEMRRDGRVAGDWTTYSNLASIYVDAGLIQKAETALKELENRIEGQCLEAYQFLITLYGRTGNLPEVNRIWRSLKSTFRTMANISYLNMIHVLVKLKDLPGAEACFKEWESNHSPDELSKPKSSAYDIRVANALMMGYLEEGKISEAEAILESARKHGGEPNSKTWELLMNHYLKVGEMQIAARFMADAITNKQNHKKWVPPEEVIKVLLTHYEKEKNVAGAEQLFELLKTVPVQPESAYYEALIRTYASAKKKNLAMRQRLKVDNVTVSQEVEKLLTEVCEE